MTYLTESFYTQLESLPALPPRACSETVIAGVLAKSSWSLQDLPALLQISRDEDMALLLKKAEARHTRRHGRRLTLYAPLYVSNYCENECCYCGFNRRREKERVVLTAAEVLTEADYLLGKGLGHVLVVSGEAADRAGAAYFAEIIAALASRFNFVGLEVQPLNEAAYRDLSAAGLDGVTVYQETYDRERYSRYHPAGPKRDFRYRLETPERVARAGIANAAIGALLGLAPYREEVWRVAHHLDYLIRNYWTTSFSLSFPRINTEALDFAVPHPVADFDFVKTVAALRLVFPDTPFYLSTREQPYMRDNLVHYGINQLSVESCTEPGGYTLKRCATEQFAIADNRSVEDVVAALRGQNIRPVFKDWDRGYRRTVG